MRNVDIEYEIVDRKLCWAWTEYTQLGCFCAFLLKFVIFTLKKPDCDDGLRGDYDEKSVKKFLLLTAACSTVREKWTVFFCQDSPVENTDFVQLLGECT